MTLTNHFDKFDFSSEVGIIDFDLKCLQKLIMTIKVNKKFIVLFFDIFF